MKNNQKDFIAPYLKMMYFVDSFVTGPAQWCELLKSGDRLHEIYTKMRKKIKGNDFEKYHAEIIGNLEYEKAEIEAVIKKLQSQKQVKPIIEKAEVEYFSEDACKRLKAVERI